MSCTSPNAVRCKTGRSDTKCLQDDKAVHEANGDSEGDEAEGEEEKSEGGFKLLGYKLW